MDQGGGGHGTLQLRCRITGSLQAADTDRDLALLDEDERDMAGRLRHAEDRRDYVAAHTLLRRMLSAAAPGTAPAAWRFDRRSGGKPHVRGAGSTLPFSLSHTRGLVACVVGRDGELGLDVERDAVFDIEGLKPGVCSAGESAQLATLRQPERTAAFLDLWTLKEAHAKARGTGITGGLAATAFDLRVAGVISGRLGPEGAEQCRFALFRPTADSRMALAVENCGREPAALEAALVGSDEALAILHPIRTGTLDRGDQ